jgi:hypothetical protein
MDKTDQWPVVGDFIINFKEGQTEMHARSRYYQAYQFSSNLKNICHRAHAGTGSHRAWWRWYTLSLGRAACSCTLACLDPFYIYTYCSRT